MRVKLETAVARHYENHGLIGKIISGLENSGIDTAKLSMDDLAAVDEFHIGGREASKFVAASLGVDGPGHVLDVGCGIGGPARLVAAMTGCKVTGIDLVSDYIEAAERLNELTGMADRVTCIKANALDLPFGDGTFDAVFSMHVAMNIEDRAGLYDEIARVIRPGGVFCAYDVMRTGEGEIAFPVPWAGSAETSFLVDEGEMRELMAGAGFSVEKVKNKANFALEFFDKLIAGKKAMPSGLSVHLVMGQDAGVKIANTRANIAAGLIAPVQLVARKKQ